MSMVLFLDPLTGLLEALPPSTPEIICICIVGLSLLFANGTVYSCFVAAAEATQNLENAQFRPNFLGHRHYRHRINYRNVEKVIVALNFVLIIMTICWKTTSRNWVVDGVIWRLITSLVLTTAFLSGVRAISKHMHWYKFEFRMVELFLHICRVSLITSASLWFLNDYSEVMHSKEVVQPYVAYGIFPCPDSHFH